MNPFTRHPHEQGISYGEHAAFALSVAYRLWRSTLLFALHGVLPWSPIPKRFDLEATARFLHERSAWIERSASETKAVPSVRDLLVGQQFR